MLRVNPSLAIIPMKYQNTTVLFFRLFSSLTDQRRSTRMDKGTRALVLCLGFGAGVLSAAILLAFFKGGYFAVGLAGGFFALLGGITLWMEPRR